MNIKKYFIAGLFVMGVAATSFAQGNNNDSLNQSSPKTNRNENSSGEPDLNSDRTKNNSFDQDDNASSSSRIHKNSPADNAKDAKYYGDPSTERRMKSSGNMKSTGNRLNESESSKKSNIYNGKESNSNTSASAKKKAGSSYNGSPNPDAVER